MDWLTASDALALLGTQPQTLYANVSRGRIEARADPADNRRSLYRGDDVRRLARRGAGRRKQEAVASEAMQWGEPVLVTAVSTVRSGRLIYRGVDACELARTATLEDVAALLWQAPVVLESAIEPKQEGGVEAAFATLAGQAAQSRTGGRSPGALAREAGTVVEGLARALTGGWSSLPLHERLALAWGRSEASDAIRRALVLLADHELNASTFAARVTVSTGASPWAGALAGLSALSGSGHGRASRVVTALVDDVGGDVEALRDWLGEGRSLPGLGHRLYRHGDPRCPALLAAFELTPDCSGYLEAAIALTGDMPNVDFALAALVARYDLPDEAAFMIFALGRSVGWLAHMIEQVESGAPIRPRARYVGASPDRAG